MISYGKPFDRKEFFKNVGYFIEHHWGSYESLINLTMKDMLEIKIGIQSKEQNDALEKALSN